MKSNVVGIKLPGQINFKLTDEDLNNDLMEIMTQFNMVKKDKIYRNIFKAGLKAMSSKDLTLKDFE